MDGTIRYLYLLMLSDQAPYSLQIDRADTALWWIGRLNG